MSGIVCHVRMRLNGLSDVHQTDKPGVACTQFGLMLPVICA